MSEIQELKSHIKKLESVFTAALEELEIIEDVDYNILSADERFEFNQIKKIKDRLWTLHHILEYVNMSVTAEGILFKNEAGRYALDEYTYFTCGSDIEVLIKDADGENYWVKTRVEHDGEDYYLVNFPQLSMLGLYVRKRGSMTPT
ncbi:DUF5348 domain-containing protein [Microaerobacter geothermalis]|uniref:DUF5348 domain-containing protein n=1 Tax=Microaerobacter geothermalis TaxID=674972 RepID=UPI001F251C3E|nr:DUF5348 domain-containing protein [Microaerobacter geothermalis]MCF6094321.1 DUF5348 domain-containing protein [Microaerobacter geothermalis]